MTADLLLEPGQLGGFLDQHPEAVLVDTGSTESYSKHHIPGAIYFDYRNLVCGTAPAPGDLPDMEQLSRALADAGIHSNKVIIAYDDEGGGKASRLLWTLNVLGFPHLYLINGGLHAWVMEERELETGENPPVPTEAESLEYNREKVADKAYILAQLENPGALVWDTRTAEEYNGDKPRARRNGHIPGAVHLNWVDTVDRENGLRYLPREQLLTLLNSKGITPDKTIIPYCHTHHRSAHSTILLEYLDYPDIRAYPGSWSEWGNADDTPVED